MIKGISQQVEMQKVCENKAVLKTGDYIVAMKMTKKDVNV
jgi:hypothetical protein